jgi:hypothetical protein
MGRGFLHVASGDMRKGNLLRIFPLRRERAGSLKFCGISAREPDRDAFPA